MAGRPYPPFNVLPSEALRAWSAEPLPGGCRLFHVQQRACLPRSCTDRIPALPICTIARYRGPWDTSGRASCHPVVAVVTVLAPDRRLVSRGSNAYMQLVIAAALAVVTALAEFTIAPYLRIGDAVLQPVLVFGVIWTIAGGLEAGLVWAFVGGLALDILGQRPLGSSAFAMLVAIGLASVIGGLLSRVRLIAPVIATAIVSPVYSMLLLVSITALSSAPMSSAAFDSVLPTAIYNTVLAALVGPLTVAIVTRRQAAERMDW